MSLITQSGSYIPKTDSGIRDWLNNFAAKIAVDPVAYGLTAGDSAVISDLADDYDAAYQLAKEPQTRTPGTVADKDAKRNQAVETVRNDAIQIKKNLGVTDQQKIDLGIHIDDQSPTPIPAPTTIPLLAIVKAETGVHTLRYADSETPTSRAKPPGATHLQLYVAVGDEPTADWEQAKFVGAYTAQPIEVSFEPADAGKTATYFARWMTQRGLVGEWSLPVAMIIAFGGPVELQSAA